MLYCVCGAETAPALERSMKMAVLKGLKPEKVFAYFEKLSVLKVTVFAAASYVAEITS